VVEHVDQPTPFSLISEKLSDLPTVMARVAFEFAPDCFSFVWAL
jgi:hypothetical protein